MSRVLRAVVRGSMRNDVRWQRRLLVGSPSLGLGGTHRRTAAQAAGHVCSISRESELTIVRERCHAGGLMAMRLAAASAAGCRPGYRAARAHSVYRTRVYSDR